MLSVVISPITMHSAVYLERITEKNDEEANIDLRLDAFININNKYYHVDDLSPTNYCSDQ
jgi:hypothetical protein